MTVEYVILMALFAMFFMGTLMKGPFNSFENAGPKLGARVEKHLEVGSGFQKTTWEPPP